MNKLVPYLLLLLLASAAHAAPKEEASDPEEKKVTEREVAVVNDGWIEYFNNNSWTIGSAVLGVLFVLSGLGVFSYYYVYAGAVGAYDPAVNNAVYQGQPNYMQAYGTNYATGRSLNLGGSSWNMQFVKVLDYIDIARKSYEGFDWQNLDCQKRVLCELSQEKSLAGETGRKITNSYLLSLVDAVQGLPIPQVIQLYLNEYKEAIMQGKSSKKACGDIYADCKFSFTQLVKNVQDKKTN